LGPLGISNDLPREKKKESKKGHLFDFEEKKPVVEDNL